MPLRQTEVSTRQQSAESGILERSLGQKYTFGSYWCVSDISIHEVRRHHQGREVNEKKSKDYVLRQSHVSGSGNEEDPAKEAEKELL